MKNKILCGLLLLALPTLYGCGNGDLDVTPASGRITFEGKPLSGGGRVRFIPLNDQEEVAAAKPASGDIQDDGSFTLSTYEAEDGAVPGLHRVEVIQDPFIVPDAFEKGELIRPAVLVAQEDLIPSIYKGQDSPLRATVEVGGDEIQISLERAD